MNRKPSIVIPFAQFPGAPAGRGWGVLSYRTASHTHGAMSKPPCLGQRHHEIQGADGACREEQPWELGRRGGEANGPEQKLSCRQGQIWHTSLETAQARPKLQAAAAQLRPYCPPGLTLSWLTAMVSDYRRREKLSGVLKIKNGWRA